MKKPVHLERPNDSGEFGDTGATNSPVRTAVAISFAIRATGAFTTLISSMVIARLLTPAETGVFAIGISLVMLLDVLREFGITGYLVQVRDLSREQIRAAFTITLLMSVGAGCLLFFFREPLSGFYGEPALARVLSVLSISFLLAPLGAPALALLRREFKFAALYRISACANLAAASVSIGMALKGYGPVSMAYGSVASAGVSFILASATRASDSLIAPTLRGWTAVLTFGGQSSAASIMPQLASMGTQLLIGRMLGIDSVGLFSRAYNVIYNARANIFGSFFSVAFPVLAARFREGQEIREPYLRVCALITGIAWPMYGLLFLAAAPLFRVLYGPQWGMAVPLFRLLVLGELTFQCLPFVEAILLATGRVDQFVRGETIVQAGRCILIAAAALHSLRAVCIAEALHYVLFVAVFSRRVLPFLEITFIEFAKAHFRSAALTASSLAIPGLLLLIFGADPGVPSWQILILETLGAGAGWVLGIFALAHPLRHEVVRVAAWLHRRGLRPVWR